MTSLETIVRNYGRRNADRDGVARTPVSGLMVKYVEAPHGNLHAMSRPLLIWVLQGTKHMIVGRGEQRVDAGETIIVRADLPAVTRVEQASRESPYLAVAVELQTALLREISEQLIDAEDAGSRDTSLSASAIEQPVSDCVSRLVQLLERPESISLLEPGLLRELHYWLLSGRHGPAVRALADGPCRAGRMAAAISTIRTDFRLPLPLARLAETAGMSVTSFHRHFKTMTSLTPLKYQKRLRLIEARRLMLEDGSSASSAAFEVGYESVSQFVREYGRLFDAPPKRDVQSIRDRSQERKPFLDGTQPG